jgi:hypothetical protein
MKLTKKILLTLFLYLLLNGITMSYEDKDSLYIRINLSKKISKYSNNTIKLGVSETKGLSTLANDFIDLGQPLLKIPKKYTLCPYYIFPFKYEILRFLLEIPGLKQSIKQDQKVTVFLLTYYLLYYIYAPKQEIKNYIVEKKLAQYYKCEEIEEDLKEYFPKIVPGSGLLNKEHYRLLYNLGYSVPYENDLNQIFANVNVKIQNSEHRDIMSSWTSNLEQFKWAYSMIMSRSFTVKINEYFKLEGIKEGPDSKMDSSMKKNIEVNKYIFPPNLGAPCLMAFADLFNHYQPQYLELRDRRSMLRDTEKGNFLFISTHRYYPGQEIIHTYHNDPSNIMLFFHYGFVIPNNIFNIYNLKIEDNIYLSYSQIELCKELKCVEVRVKDTRNLPRTRIYNARLSVIDERLLNYGRVLYLNNDIDKKAILKKLANEPKISFQNEVMAWIYYYISFKNYAKNNNLMLGNSLKGTQKYRNIVKNVEKYWINQETKKDEWTRNKIYENIHLLDVSYKKIVTKNMLVSINRVIYNTNNELEKLRLKFMT